MNEASEEVAAAHLESCRGHRRVAHGLAPPSIPPAPLDPAASPSALIGVGLLLINVFNVYVTTRLVENQSDTYGALGIAATLLFSLVLVRRLVVL